MKKTFDIIVIGAGSGGLNVAGFMNRIGLRVLLIDKEDRSIGGDCLNYGCVPSKALLHTARLIREGRESSRFGLSVSGTIDVKKAMEYVSGKQEHIREHENAEYFRALGMTVVLGKATFVDYQTVEVAGTKYRGKKIVIATGSRPRTLNLPGIESINVFTNENIFSLDVLPNRMVVVGAGPIGIELGQALSAFGTKVTVVGSGLLEKEDPEMVAVLREQLEKDGMEFLLGYKPTEVKDGNLLVANEAGETQSIPTDALLISIGRELNVEGLQLDTAGIQTNGRGGIVADEYLQTTNKNILVCGDVAGGHMFTHTAELHASLIIRNFFSPLKKKLNTDAMSWVTYTNPEIATFGLEEKTLKHRGMQYEVLSQSFSNDDRAIVDEYKEGKMKLFVSQKGKVLGGTMVAQNAGELTQELMLAQANGMKMQDFMKKVYPYPTATRINRSIVLQYMSRKLTESSMKFLRTLFRLEISGTVIVLLLTIVFVSAFLLSRDSVSKSDANIVFIEKAQSQAFANHAPYADYSPEAYAFSLRAGRTVLFFAATTWCSSCVELDKEIRERLSEIPLDVTILKVDFDKDYEMKIRHKVTLQTTLILLDENGQEMKRFIGTGFDQMIHTIE